MTSLSGKSADEIVELLDEYGIKHGPVVASTRSLYERKLKEAMARGTTGHQSPDKTFYREEQEEVTYVYRTPVQGEVFGSDRSSRSPPDWATKYQPETPYSHSSSVPRSRPNFRGRDVADDPDMYDMPSSHRSSYLQSAPVAVAPAAADTNTSSVSMWLRIVVFLALVVFVYLVFSSMETNESLQGIE